MMRACFVPGVPLATCDGDAATGGLAVELFWAAFSERNWTAACVPLSLSLFDGSCAVVSGAIGSVQLARFVLENYTIGPPYFASSLSLLFAMPGAGVSGWAFLDPFSATFWVTVFASISAAALTAVAISRWTDASFLWTAPTAIAGSSRLYDSRDDESYAQHALSVATAVFSLMLWAAYTSNLLTFVYLSPAPVGVTTDVAVLASPDAAWLARRSLIGNYIEEFQIADASGRPSGAALALVRGGSRALFAEIAFLDAACASSPGSYAISSFEFVRNVFAPLLLADDERLYADLDRVTQQLTRALVLPQSGACRAVGAGPRSIRFLDEWGVFVIVAACAAALVIARLISMQQRFGG